MPFEPGVSGNPGGRRAEKPYRDALRKVLAEKVDFAPKKARTKLEAVARKHCAEAIAGSVSAMREIADRLDGKAVQSLAGADGESALFPQAIAMIPVPPDASDK